MFVQNTALLTLSILLTACLAAPSGEEEPGGRALIAIARAAVVEEVTGVPEDSRPLPPRETTPQGIFVTVERKGTVIGCRGGLGIRGRTLQEEITRAARAAAGHDPRYRPMTPADLRDFKVTVTLVDSLEPLAAGQIRTLSPGEGLVLTAGTRTGVVLPWEGKEPIVRLRWAYRKAGIAPGSPCTLRRMIARRYRG
ncbi:MAG: AMMECR1 domain-containing protein [Cytophagales bacterium]|nr:AMMECR1 domain-containing protein [Armatimonadota bacterium]